MELVIYGGGGHGQDIRHDLEQQGHQIVGVRDDDPARAWGSQGAPMVCGANWPDVREWIVHKTNGAIWWQRGVWVHRSAMVGPGVDLGNHVHVNAGSFLTRCTVGKFTTIGPAATICGDVHIGKGVTIGAGATVRNLVTIGDGATIGCGAVVVADVLPGRTVKGVPAR